ncbi:MAG TPA: DUF1579 domain-containing protein [Chthoniobacterales bacterium]|jgi:hypothetical protein
MKTLKSTIAILLATGCLVAPTFAQETPASKTDASPAAGSMQDQEMMAKMMEMAKLNENHKLLASLNGDWKYTVKMWMNGDPSSKPDVSHGSATRKSIMGGRFVVMEAKGKMEMPGADGKSSTMEFMGRGTEGYDNAKRKFVASWVDNTGTGIMMSEGNYDEASKTFTYTSEYEAAPGMKISARETLKLDDKNHMTMEWYENRGGQEMKTMEIDYTRQK